MKDAPAFAAVGSAITARMDQVKAVELRLADDIARCLAEVRAALASTGPPGAVAEALTHVAEALTWDAEALMAESLSDPRLAADALAAVLRLAPLPPPPAVTRLSVVGRL